MYMRFLLGAVLTLLVVPVTALGGQTSAECSLGGSAFSGYGIQGKLNVPYRATIKSTFEQKLPDGNSIQAFVRVQQARDSLGRTRAEMAQGCERGEDGQLHARMSVNLNDPVAKTHAFWLAIEGQPKIVHVTHLDVKPPVPRTLDAEQEKQRKLMRLRQPPKSEFKIEDLGEKTIAGVQAQGSRNLRTIAAGEEGNTLPLVVVSENWNSKDLGIMLIGINDDPRRGRTTVEVEELTQGEPDESLFALPAGYKVEELHPNAPMQSTP
jgi:hypothetical protein